jgi:hypothetical protein
MKRTIFSIMAIGAIAFTSCKKDDVDSTEVGSATINGNVWADLNQTDDTDGNGLYIQALNPEGVDGMQVSIELNTANLVQSPEPGYTYDKEVYTTTADANGDYTLTIPATEEGFTVTLKFGDVHTTRTIFATDGVSTITEDVEVTLANQTQFVFAGGTHDVKDQATVSTTGADAYDYGSATIMGTVYGLYYWGINWTGSVYDYPLNAASGITGKDILMTYDIAPYGNGGENVFNIVIDSDGNYEMTVPTEASGDNGVEVSFGMMDFIAETTGPNMAGTADSTDQARYFMPGGIYNISNFPLQDGDIIPNVNLVLQIQPL